LIINSHVYLRAFFSVVLAASVIGMFLYSLSEKTFHKGLKIYLSKSTTNPEGVAIPDNFYDALQQAVDDDKALPENYKIEEVFGSWEKTAGYPIVYVERSYNDYRIRFTQVRTFLDHLLTFNQTQFCVCAQRLTYSRIDLRIRLRMEKCGIHCGIFRLLMHQKLIRLPKLGRSFG
jgi:hypothetical protein